MPPTNTPHPLPPARDQPERLRWLRGLLGDPRLVLLSGIVALVLLILTVTEVLIREETASAMRHAERRTEILTRALREQVTADLTLADAVLRGLGAEMLRNRTPLQEERLARMVEAIPGTTGSYALMDGAGKLLWSSGTFQIPAAVIAEHLAAHARAAAPGISPLHIGAARAGPAPGNWIADLSLRIVDSHGSALGLVFGVLDMAPYQRAYVDLHLGDNSVLRLLRPDGRVVMRVTAGEISLSQPPGDGAWAATALLMHGECRTRTGPRVLNDIDLVGSYCQLRTYPLITAVSVSRSTLLADSRITASRYRAMAFAVLALLAGGTLALLAMLNRQQVMRQALHHSESRFRALSALGSDWYWETDARYRFMRVSEGLLRLSGRTESEYLGKTAWEIPFCAPAESAWDAHRAVIAQQSPFRDLCLRYLSPGGVVGYASFSGEPVFGAAGEFAGYRGVGKDITAEMMLRQRLRMQHDVLRVLSQTQDAESAFRGVIETICRTMEWGWGARRHLDRDTLILSCRESWLAPGLEADEFVAASHLVKPANTETGVTTQAMLLNEIVWHADQGPGSHRRRDAVARAANLHGTVVVPIPRRKETEDALEFFSTRVEVPDPVLLDTLNAIALELGQFMDGIEARLAGEHLERERRHLLDRLQLQLNHMPIACLIQDRNFHVEYFNPAAERIFGYTAAEIQGRDIIDFLVPENERAAVWGRRASLQAGERNVTATNENVTRDGRTIVCEWSMTHIMDETGAFSGVLLVAQDVTEREKMIAALEDSEARYRHIFVAAPVPMWVADTPTPRILAVNDAAVEKYGYSREELLQMTAIDLQLPEDRGRVFTEITGRDAQLPMHFERRHVTRDGRLILAEVTARPFQFGGRTARLIVANDVTERRHAQQALEASEARFRAIFEQASVGIGIREVSSNPRWLRVNRKLCEMLGYSEAELLQMTSVDITPEADRAETGEYNARLRAGDLHSYSRQKRYQRKDGRMIWVELSIAMVDGADGKPQHLISVIQDITESVGSRQMLVESEARYRQIFALTPLPMILRNEETLKFIEVNDACLATYGYTREEMLNMTAVDVQVPEQREEFLLQAERGTMNVTTSLRKRHLRKNGEIFDVEIYSFPTTLGAERVRLSLLRDMTEQLHSEQLLRENAIEIRRLNADLEKRVEQRTQALAALNRELESFSYSVSHDLRAPLRSIDGFSQILLQEYAGSLDDTARGYLERVRAGSQRMARLIDDLLELARVTRRDLQVRTCDLTALAREIAQELRQAEPGRRARFVVADGMRVSADPGLLRIVMDNLLRNAWKFTGTKAETVIEVGHAAADGEPTYFVRDNGVGFDMAYVNKLFGAFQRLHSDAEFQGTGIGLALVQRVIRRHGGQVRGEGIPDRGATFYFMLPEYGVVLPGPVAQPVTATT